MKNYKEYSFTLTSLRKDVLKIIESATRPLKAYEILNILLKKRPNAKPPTVYRVLDFLVEKHVIHKVNSSHTYVLCQYNSSNNECEKHGKNIDLILACQHCHQYVELTNSIASLILNQLLQEKEFIISDHCIELKGICINCKNKKKL